VLQVDDYLTPIGDLNVAVLWPRLDGETEAQRDERAEDDVEAYRSQAYQQTSDDALSRKWVNYRAWSRFADVLNGIPAQASNDEGGRQYLAQQIEYWSLKAAAALEEFESETAVEGSAFGVITSLR
jgi:hypothetical protein